MKSCRRLGKPVPERVQNLLVTLSSAEDVEFLVSNARCLRRSSNEFVRKSIYINRDLTAAEAKALYDLRCTRRQRAAANQVRRNETQPHSIPDDGSQFNVAAPAFVPQSTNGSQSSQSGGN